MWHFAWLLTKQSCSCTCDNRARADSKLAIMINCVPPVHHAIQAQSGPGAEFHICTLLRGKCVSWLSQLQLELPNLLPGFMWSAPCFCNQAFVLDQWLQMVIWKETDLSIIGVVDHDSDLWGYSGPGTTWANEMHCPMNHAPGVGSIARPVDGQFMALPLSYGCCYYIGQDEHLLRACLRAESWR